MGVSVLYHQETYPQLLDEEWVSLEALRTYLQLFELNGVLDSLASHLFVAPGIKHFTRLARYGFNVITAPFITYHAVLTDAL